jgi:hypothetical protein
MSACAPFIMSVPSGTAQDAFLRVQAAIVGHGGAMNGDATKGDFTVPTPFGSVAGAYAVDGLYVTITITQKPFLLSCAAIEEFINSKTKGQGHGL